MRTKNCDDKNISAGEREYLPNSDLRGTRFGCRGKRKTSAPQQDTFVIMAVDSLCGEEVDEAAPRVVEEELERLLDARATRDSFRHDPAAHEVSVLSKFLKNCMSNPHDETKAANFAHGSIASARGVWRGAGQDAQDRESRVSAEDEEGHDEDEEVGTLKGDHRRVHKTANSVSQKGLADVTGQKKKKIIIN